MLILRPLLKVHCLRTPVIFLSMAFQIFYMSSNTIPVAASTRFLNELSTPARTWLAIKWTHQSMSVLKVFALQSVTNTPKPVLILWNPFQPLKSNSNANSSMKTLFWSFPSSENKSVLTLVLSQHTVYFIPPSGVHCLQTNFSHWLGLLNLLTLLPLT